MSAREASVDSLSHTWSVSDGHAWARTEAMQRARRASGRHVTIPTKTDDTSLP